MAQFDYRLRSAEFLQNPYPLYRQLSDEAPVYWSDTWGCWILTRYEDVTATLQNYRHFTSLGRLTATMDLPEPLWERVQPLVTHYSQGLINVDPPAHTRMRQLVHKAFAPRTIRNLQQHIKTIVNGLLDDIEDKGEMDVIKDFSYPLPVTVIAQMLGIPVEDHEKFKRWSGEIVAFMATPKPDPTILLQSQDALQQLQAYFQIIFEKRRQNPQDDLISALVSVEMEGDKLTEDELVSTCITILIGGHETTTHLIASGLYVLMQNPDQMQLLKNNLDYTESAVEEFLRYEGPFQRNRRIATTDTNIKGMPIKQGDLVLQLLGAANRDPQMFDRPDQLDIQRQSNKHVSFGYGAHFCLGASLARLEASVAFRALLERFTSFEMATTDVQWMNTVFRGLTALPIRFEKAKT